MKLNKRRICLPPCPPYDIEGTESWLYDLSSEGWRLEKDGFFFGLAFFEKQPPAKIRYRLEAAQKHAGDYNDYGGAPDPEAIELNEEYGWQYVARRGQFYIYKNETEKEREINTDPQVQALAIKTLQKRITVNYLSTLVFLIIYPLFLALRGMSVVLTAAETGLFFTLLSFVIILSLVPGGLFEVLHLRRLKKKLENGELLDHQKDWKKERPAYFIRKTLKAVLIVVWFLLLGHMWNNELMETNRKPLSAMRGNTPFATIPDSAGGDYKEAFDDLSFNYVTAWDNALIEQGVIWSENADVQMADGTNLYGILHIVYYDTKAEWIARALFNEYQRYDRIRAGKNYEPLDCPYLPADEQAAYRSILHIPTVIFRKETIVVRAFYSQSGSADPLSLEQWTKILAGSVNEEAR